MGTMQALLFEQNAQHFASIQDQIDEVKREIAMRERMYPIWIKRKALTEHGAARQLGLMRAVLTTLMTLNPGAPR
jgi:hypothetical protein